MSAAIEFHFDFGSPNAYLAHRVMPDISARTGATIRYVPVLLGGIFKATNNVSPAISLQGIKNKGEYERLEMQRFVKRHAITNFAPNPFFPVNTLQIMRGAVAAQKLDCFEGYVDAVYQHMWAEPKKMDDPEVIAAALSASELPTDALLAATQEPEVKAELISNTEDSVSRGSFGSPSFYVGDALFFGKDRLRDFEEEITRSSSR